VESATTENLEHWVIACPYLSSYEPTSIFYIH
jgi:hypothetical protein